MAADLVSQLQETLNILLSQYISAVGTLQRDAGPVSLRGEQVMPSAEQEASRSDGPGSQQISDFAQQISTTSKAISGLVQQLPDVTQSEEEQLQGIAQLQVEQEEAKAAYRAARLQLEDKLAQVSPPRPHCPQCRSLQHHMVSTAAAQVQQAFGALADWQLQHPEQPP